MDNSTQVQSDENVAPVVGNLRVSGEVTIRDTALENLSSAHNISMLPGSKLIVGSLTKVNDSEDTIEFSGADLASTIEAMGQTIEV